MLLRLLRRLFEIKSPSIVPAQSPPRGPIWLVRLDEIPEHERQAKAISTERVRRALRRLSSLREGTVIE